MSFYNSFILNHQKELFHILNTVMVVTWLYVFVKICIVIHSKE